LAVAFGWSGGDMDDVTFIARLCLIVCMAMTLAMPRVAWAAHQIGHPPVSLTEAHSLTGHHDEGHHHGDALEEADTDRDGGNADGDDQQPVHTHGGLTSLTALDLPTNMSPATLLQVSETLHFDLAEAQLSPADFPREKRPPRFV
jgi:hypothetical protein